MSISLKKRVAKVNICVIKLNSFGCYHLFVCPFQLIHLDEQSNCLLINENGFVKINKQKIVLRSHTHIFEGHKNAYFANENISN